MSKQLYITNLPFQMTEEELKTLFGKYGKVTEVTIPTEHNSARPRGYAFVTFETEEAAKKAQEEMHEYESYGRQLCVTIAEKKRSRGGRWQ